jgi:hypothetical protein
MPGPCARSGTPDEVGVTCCHCRCSGTHLCVNIQQQCGLHNRGAAGLQQHGTTATCPQLVSMCEKKVSRPLGQSKRTQGLPDSIRADAQSVRCLVDVSRKSCYKRTHTHTHSPVHPTHTDIIHKLWFRTPLSHDRPPQKPFTTDHSHVTQCPALPLNPAPPICAPQTAAPTPSPHDSTISVHMYRNRNKHIHTPASE